MASTRFLRLAVAACLPCTLAAASVARAAPCRTVVDLDVRWDPGRAATVSGIVVRLGYPPSLDVPVDAASGSARARVENRTGMPGGLFDAIRRDADGDGSGELLSVGLVTQGMEPGPFARVTFDCPQGAAVAEPDAFTCTADVADEQGGVPASCTVRVAGG